MSGIVVASGPSLRKSDRIAYPDIRFVGPAGDGDVLRICSEKPTAIGIVDGVFRERLPVGHKEILWALSEGIPVFGAASIGALRAAELERYGMIGIGKICDAYKSGELVRDADVALIHGPGKLGFPSLTVAVVDLVVTLRTLVYSHRLTKEEADALLNTALGIHFSKRSWRLVVERAQLQTQTADSLCLLLEESQVERKRLDAIMLLERMTSHKLKRPNCPRPPITPAFADALRRAGLQPESQL